MNYQELMWEISQLKKNLKDTDYMAIKHSEGLIADIDYDVIKNQRQEWRNLINQYEAQLPEAKAEWDNRVIEQDEIEEVEEQTETEQLWKN